MSFGKVLFGKVATTGLREIGKKQFPAPMTIAFSKMFSIYNILLSGMVVTSGVETIATIFLNT